MLVLIGLVATRAGFPHADALAAIGVAGFIAVAGYRLGRTTIDALVDRAPEGLTDAIRSLVMHDNTSVAAIEAIRLRPSGAKIVGDVVVSVSRTLPLERVAGIKAELQSRIARKWPQAELTITANPLALDNETILERVLVIAARRGLPVHHVTIQDIEARKTVALDLEVDGAMTLGDAHRLASELEDAIAAEIGEDVEVETHIEPAEPELSGQLAEPDLARRIEASLAATAAEQGRVRDIHDVRVRETPGGVFVLFHCHVDAGNAGRDRSRRRRFARALGQGRLFPKRAGSSAMPSRRATEGGMKRAVALMLCMLERGPNGAIMGQAFSSISALELHGRCAMTDNAASQYAPPSANHRPRPRPGAAAGSIRSSASLSSSSPPGSSGTPPGTGTAGRAPRVSNRRTTPSSPAT